MAIISFKNMVLSLNQCKPPLWNVMNKCSLFTTIFFYKFRILAIFREACKSGICRTSLQYLSEPHASILTHRLATSFVLNTLVTWRKLHFLFLFTPRVPHKEYIRQPVMWGTTIIFTQNSTAYLIGCFVFGVTKLFHLLEYCHLILLCRVIWSMINRFFCLSAYLVENTSRTVTLAA